jgi:hypothetical protein
LEALQGFCRAVGALTEQFVTPSGIALVPQFGAVAFASHDIAIAK